MTQKKEQVKIYKVHYKIFDRTCIPPIQSQKIPSNKSVNLYPRWIDYFASFLSLLRALLNNSRSSVGTREKGELANSSSSVGKGEVAPDKVRGVAVPE